MPSPETTKLTSIKEPVGRPGLRMTSLSSHTAINRCRKNTAAKHSINSASTQHHHTQDKDYENQHKEQQPVTLNGEPLEETDSFIYMGSTINKNGGTDEDVKARIQKARVAFIMLRQIWRAKQIKINTKLRLFNSNVKAVLLYGSETWRSTQKTLTRIQTFINKCLCQILTDNISNTTLWKITKQLTVES